MQQHKLAQRRSTSYWIGLGCVLSVGFWIADSGIAVWLFGEHSFSAQLFRPERREFFDRLCIGGLLLAFSLYAATVMRQRTRTDAALRESEARFRDLIESGAGIYAKRDSLPSIAYSEELISATISATLQSTDRHHGIVG